jgi:2-oxo-3-hexenedioate decarboxylase
MTAGHLDRIAADLFGLLGTGRQIEPITAGHPGFGPAEAATVAARVARLRLARGERPVGRKIGFTNTTIWPLYGVDRPIWGHVFDTTLHEPIPETLATGHLAEPRIEPEIVLGLGRAPEAGMDEAELIGCVAWVAHGFEIVQSVYPGWRFAVADCVAAFGLHGALALGERHPVAGDPSGWKAALEDFTLAIHRDGEPVAEGHARNVLGGPLGALRHLVEALAVEPGAPPLAAGEIVTTGTITDAFPVAPGQRWSTRIAGLPVEGIALRIV